MPSKVAAVFAVLTLSATLVSVPATAAAGPAGTAATVGSAPAADPTADPDAKIAVAVADGFDRHQRQDFWITLTDQADTTAARRTDNWTDRGRRVVDSLQRTARDSQSEVLALLRKADVDYRSYWISNAIQVTGGTAKLAAKVARLPEVDEVRAPRTYIQPEPTPSVERRAAAVGPEWGIRNINADDVWAQYDTRGDGIVIANLDSGVQYDHPALVGSYRGNNGDGTFTHDYNWFDPSGLCSGAPCDSDTTNSHGSHTMGTMVGDDGAGNQIGVAPGATWIAANGCATCTDADLLASSQWFLAPTKLDGSDPDPSKRPDIVNNSWGSTSPTNDPLFEDAQQAWVDAGIMGVWANGNSGQMGCASSGSPGSRTINYSVGAYDENNTIASFSGRGPGQDGEIKPSISAPGVAVRSSQQGNSYGVLNGTSMAAPHVAGAIALLWAAYPALVRDIDATRTLLDLSATDTADDQCGGTAEDNNSYGEGRLDALAMLDLAATGLGTLTGTITDTESGDPIAATVTVSGPIDRETVADADGHYSRRLVPGDYQVDVAAFGYAGQSASVTIGKDTTATVDLALQALPSATVSGTVTEASAHGWPLYGTATVAGMPDGVFHTDPVTGRYSMDLPVGETYEVTFAARYPGIEPRTESITVDDAGQVKDIALTADQYACTAPGYQPNDDVVLTQESFDAEALPDGWTILDNLDNGQVWNFDDPTNRGNNTGGSGGFSWVFSYQYGADAEQDTTLVSPSYDLSDTSTPALWFNTAYSGSSSTADIDVSTDGGASWTNAWRHTTESLNRSRVRVPIPQVAGQADVTFRFHYTASFDLWWQVDNIAIGERVCDAVDGGMLVGNVRDRNTGDPLVGATVRSDTLADLTIDTVATPTDPGLDDGFYWVFAPVTGEHDLTASMSGYHADSRRIDIGADAATRADFEPTAGLLSVDRDAIDVALAIGQRGTAEVTVRNDGTAPAAVEVAETPLRTEVSTAGSTSRSLDSQKGAALQHISGKFSPTDFGFTKNPKTSAAAGKSGVAGKSGTAEKSATAATPDVQPMALPWIAAPDHPVNTSFNVAAEHDGTIYSVGGTRGAYAYDTAAKQWSAIASPPQARSKPAAGFLGDKLYVAGGAAPSGQTRADMDIYDPRSDTWTAGPTLPNAITSAGTAVLDGKLYLVGGCRASCGQPDVMSYDPGSRRWTRLADYPVRAGWSSCGAIDGLLYCAGGTGGSGVGTRTYAYDPAADTWTRKADLPIDLWGSASSVSDGRLLLAGGVTDGGYTVTNESFGYDPVADSWSALPNANHASYSGAGACGFYKIGGSQGAGGMPYVEELPGHAACSTDDPVPWLSADPQTVTLEPGQQTTVTVTVDTAAVSQPGRYTAELSLRADTPYRTEQVTVSADLTAPKTWAKLTGTVTGTGCSGTTAAVPGAAVQVDGKTGVYSLVTDAHGEYALWLVGERQVTLTATKSGWFPESATVRVRAGNTTVQDLALTATGCANDRKNR